LNAEAGQPHSRSILPPPFVGSTLLCHPYTSERGQGSWLYRGEGGVDSPICEAKLTGVLDGSVSKVIDLIHAVMIDIRPA
jgi:hypothetical protein